MSKKQFQLMESAFKVSATFVDKCFFIAQGPNCRVTFGETNPDTEEFSPRVSIVMTFDNFKEAVGLFAGMISQIESQQKKEETPTPPVVDTPGEEISPPTTH